MEQPQTSVGRERVGQRPQESRDAITANAITRAAKSSHAIEITSLTVYGHSRFPVADGVSNQAEINGNPSAMHA